MDLNPDLLMHRWMIDIAQARWFLRPLVLKFTFNVELETYRDSRYSIQLVSATITFARAASAEKKAKSIGTDDTYYRW